MATTVNSPQRPASRPTPRPAANVQRTGDRAAMTRRPQATKHLAVKPFNMPFENKNVAIILAGIGVIALSYILMYVPETLSPISITVAPIVFIIGYCIIVPLGIMAGRGEKKAPDETKAS